METIVSEPARPETKMFKVLLNAAPARRALAVKNDDGSPAKFGGQINL